jgi:hypothetical protein
MLFKFDVKKEKQIEFAIVHLTFILVTREILIELPGRMQSYFPLKAAECLEMQFHRALKRAGDEGHQMPTSSAFERNHEKDE